VRIGVEEERHKRKLKWEEDSLSKEEEEIHGGAVHLRPTLATGESHPESHPPRQSPSNGNIHSKVSPRPL
jgi:hypothetical protein